VSKRPRGRPFQRGQSGNPGGRPKRTKTIEAKRIVADVKVAARELTPDAMDTLKQIMKDPKAPAAARVSAATAVLDRGPPIRHPGARARPPDHHRSSEWRSCSARVGRARCGGRGRCADRIASRRSWTSLIELRCLDPVRHDDRTALGIRPPPSLRAPPCEAAIAGALEQPERILYLRYVGSTVEILPPRRDPNGRWLPGGRSPNAGGLSREKRELVDVARERSPAALDKIFAIMNDETVPPAVQLAAAGMILDRGYGKPRQSVEVAKQGRTLEELLLAIHEEREAKKAQQRAEGDQEG
jgi:Family of unknown function (DUF5681)